MNDDNVLLCYGRAIPGRRECPATHRPVLPETKRVANPSGCRLEASADPCHSTVVVQRVSVVGFRVFAGCSAMVSGFAGDCFAVRLESAVAVRKPSASRGRNCEEEGRRLGSGPAASGCMMQFDKRKMSLALEMRDRELEFHAAPASGLEARAGRLVRLDDNWGQTEN